MICPKCQLNQPDDIYCALCGVNVERYRQRRRHKYIQVLVVGAVAGVFAAATLKLIAHQKPDASLVSRSIESVVGHKITHSDTRIKRKTELRGKKKYAPDKISTKISTEASAPSENSNKSIEKKLDLTPNNKEVSATAATEPKHIETKQDIVTPEGRTQRGGAAKHKVSQKEVKADAGPSSAREWLQKGLTFDDDSEEEIECYEKAIDSDAKFAPAYFRLGGIYFRQGKYEMAEDKFSLFLNFATAEQKRKYSIYDFYSPSDVAQLFKPADDDRPAKGKRNKPADKTDKPSGQPVVEDTQPEASKEAMTALKFSSVNGQILIPVVLNQSTEATFLVDTGAGVTILSREMANHLDLEPLPKHGITLKTLGDDVRADMMKLNSMRIGELEHYNIPVAVAELHKGIRQNYDGILGMDLMKNYKMHLDNDKQTITLGAQ